MMHRQRKPGYAAIAILKALKSGSRYGLDLMTATDLPSGTVYPQLGRLEARGLVQAEWESEDVARKEARPKRRYYQITESGDELLNEALRDLRHLAGPDDVPLSEAALGDA
jgi:DNA-binding PadR family transcriptional regulator